MNAPANFPPRNWHYHSGVTECSTCEGRGEHWNGRGNGGNDPDSWDIECEDCEGEGHFACVVCGFDIVVPGFDCLACETVENLPDKLLTASTGDALTAAIKVAVAVAAIAAVERAGDARRAA